jgi:hypothetical protein
MNEELGMVGGFLVVANGIGVEAVRGVHDYS